MAALEWADWAQSALPNPIVLGRVQLWGRVLPHSAGYRAAIAYPYELGVLVSETLGVADARRLERLLRPPTSWISPSAQRGRPPRARTPLLD